MVARPQATAPLWLVDTVAMRRSTQINGVSGLCITKLDVLDGIETLKLCTSYKMDHDLAKRNYLKFCPWAEGLIACEPIYEEMPGWTESTQGIKEFKQLPQAAQNYLRRLEEICEVPIDMISTGPDREETIVAKHPFK